MSHRHTKFGPTEIGYMTGDEPGYAVDGIKLVSIMLPPEAVQLIAAGRAVRVTGDGVEAIEGERAGLIVFGGHKGDRPALLQN